MQPVIVAVTLLERLTPVDRARVGMALVGLVVLLLAIVGFVILTGRMVRRQARKPLPPVRDLTDAWAAKPLSASNEIGIEDDEENSDDEDSS
jgi:hypothetical protein